MAYRHTNATIFNLCKVHAPGHDPMDEMRAHLHFMVTKRHGGSYIGRIPNVNRLQHVCLRLLRRAGRLTEAQAHILKRCDAVVRQYRECMLASA